MNTICLCGSTRFVADFQTANIELTKRGLAVITISMALPKNEQGSEDEASLKELLDLVHLNKILRADAVFVVGDGYIGRSTARELLWAGMHSKPIVCQASGKNWDQTAIALAAGYGDPIAVTRARAVLGLGKAS